LRDDKSFRENTFLQSAANLSLSSKLDSVQEETVRMAITNTELAAQLACKSNTLVEKQQKLKTLLEQVKQK
jgi:hypothetical protein